MQTLLSIHIVLTCYRLTAEHQSTLLAELKSDVHFACTDVELQVLSRGRNAVSGSSRNRRNPSAYQDATALEALIGYLYITDSDRCSTLLQWMRDRLDMSTRNRDSLDADD
jgi:ribonuclease-3 family protein